MVHPLVRLGVLVALVVLLAGCGGAVDSSDDRDAYGVDEPLDPGEIAGLSEDEVTDSYQLGLEHQDALENESYERTQTRVTRAENGSFVSLDRNHLLIGEQHALAASEHVMADANGNATVTHTVWFDGETSYARMVNDRGTVSTTENPDETPPGPELRTASRLVDVYEAVDTVDSEEANGTERYVLEGTGAVTPYENATFELVVTPSGYVEELSLEGETTSGGETLFVEEYASFESVGESIEPEEPAWVEEIEDADDTT